MLHMQTKLDGQPSTEGHREWWQVEMVRNTSESKTTLKKGMTHKSKVLHA